MAPRKKDAAAASTLEAEQNFIGAILNSPHTFWGVQDAVTPDQFTLDIHREIYSVICDLGFRGQAIAYQTVMSRLSAAGLLEYADGKETIPYIHVLMHNAREQNPEDFAGLIAEAAAWRRLEAIEKQIHAGRASGKSSATVAAEAETELLDLMQVSAPARPRIIAEVAEKVERAALEAKRTDSLPGFDTGLPSLDAILGLIMPGDLGIILKAQGDGGTALATQIGMRSAMRGPVLMFQLEMSAEAVAAREISASTRLSTKEIREGAFSQEGEDRIKQAAAALKGIPFHIEERKVTMRQLKTVATAFKRTHGLKMIIADHLQLIKKDHGNKDKWEQYEYTTSESKALAKELGVPFIWMVQRTRVGQRSESPLPRIDDAESPSVEHNADWILGLYRMKSWLRRNPPQKGGDWAQWRSDIKTSERFADVISLKCRGGAVGGETKLGWIGEITRFVETSDIARYEPSPFV